MATTTAHNLGRIHYLVHTPPALADEGPVPLLLFLHGVGERGPPDGQFFIGYHHHPLPGPMQCTVLLVVPANACVHCVSGGARAVC